ncbi:MAG: 50S ribosomal protein L3 [Omnitrophica bacterium GWA2_50_21]|nr:MAG: 50S ribosomal protein L3 [Omnitrophica bacterium GWA2_50_21]
MKGLLGRKVGMTQVFDENGQAIPVTVLEVGPCLVTGLRQKEKEGYSAVQLAFGEKKEKSATKSHLGFFKKLGFPLRKWLREIRTDVTGLKVGDELRADNFEEGNFVDVEGFSIGKGFQGVVKRHHFVGGPKSHGSMFGRVPGSIGASSFPSRVVKGMRAAGHMGAERNTVQNLKVIKVDAENHLMAVRGAVPGSEDCLVIVREALKKNKTSPWKVVEKAAEKKAETQEAPAEGEKKS